MSEAPDAGFAALLADPRAALRRLPAHVPLSALREGANAFMASAPPTPIHAVDNLTIATPNRTIAIRLYRPFAGVLPTVLFVHGGGFMLGSLETHDALCRSLARHANAAVVAIEYRLSPEAHFPAPLEDLAAVHAALVAAPPDGLDLSRVALVGDSAGAQIAAAAALSLPVSHVGLFYPLLDPACASASQQALGEGYMLTRSFAQWAWETYRGDAECDDDPRFCLSAADFSGFPPTTIITAQFDPLRDEGEALAERLRADGADVLLQRITGMIHGFAGMPQFTPCAETAIATVGRRVKASFASVE